ncbi:hypothetical protein BX616_009065 [Lobosporangium transversale]|uniref:Uncharacterized protein n=1 Tax=Lobosporangium transversale TaxID=64571 RepID=A0A1Y2GDP9_9FUNG|nr:hypothetical protein BCR41DRAFT_388716 [Lobosporangium transversale]KAF9918383.1 hypothetical protein BX616_009065 [Lobosporangium transversale]ORZ07982.1 hypothetical protein BCR41DRAFT_388716 [Lobosporangium transversale]|eukprot:XP_021878216.1 hypothetical protein BCR41DRAFT_388716 [Lobosporangium transversale]
MARSVRSSASKAPKENKAEKMRRIENYRLARAQAKKYVIPGLVAFLAAVFALFAVKYGFSGSKKAGHIKDNTLFNQNNVKDALRQTVETDGLKLNNEELIKRLIEAMTSKKADENKVAEPEKAAEDESTPTPGKAMEDDESTATTEETKAEKDSQDPQP